MNISLNRRVNKKSKLIDGCFNQRKKNPLRSNQGKKKRKTGAIIIEKQVKINCKVVVIKTNTQSENVWQNERNKKDEIKQTERLLSNSTTTKNNNTMKYKSSKNYNNNVQ